MSLMPSHEPTLLQPAGRDETGVLATELARAYRRMATFYHEQLNLSGAEADSRARGTDYTDEEAAADLTRIRERPPEEVSWFDLERLVERDPETMGTVWAEIKAAARKELASGHRTAQALAWDGRPWQRARFLAIRSSFRDVSPPQTGIEAGLIDMAAEAFSAWLELSEQYQMLAGTEAELERSSLERNGRWKPPHQITTEHTERVEHMAERAHLRFLKTVKMLTELRRLAPSVYVGHAGQINVGQQQVNVVERRPETQAQPQDLSK
jgi:hypothetical protein